MVSRIVDLGISKVEEMYPKEAFTAAAPIILFLIEIDSSVPCCLLVLISCRGVRGIIRVVCKLKG